MFRFQLRALLLLSIVASIAACSEQRDAPALSGNWLTSCEIDSRGVLRCWGNRFESVEEGVDPLARRGTPTVIPNGPWRAVGAGVGHACAIRDSGSLWCWGRNVAGQLGDGTQVDNGDPQRVGKSSDWISVAVGGGQSCGLRKGGKLYCWGGPDYGQSVDDTTGFTTKPREIAGQWRAISSHFYLTCGLQEDDSAWCWRNTEDEATGLSEFVPTQVEGSWRTIAVGILGSWGIQTDGSLWFFSCDGGGHLGSTTATQCEAVREGADSDWGDSVGAAYHGCAIKQDGSLWCFGRNDKGQSGGEPSEDVDGPTQVARAAYTRGPGNGLGGGGRGSNSHLRTQPWR
jgi:alpha-tubulin suppressor-like RCC1 family protein